MFDQQFVLFRLDQGEGIRELVQLFDAKGLRALTYVRHVYWSSGIRRLRQAQKRGGLREEDRTEVALSRTMLTKRGRIHKASLTDRERASVRATIARKALETAAMLEPEGMQE